MFKIDQIKNLFDCEQCYQLLVDPVTLSCGNSVCKRHLEDLFGASPEESNTFLCKLCGDKHSIPENGFAINKRIQNALSIEFNTLKLNPVYEECKKEINEAKNNLQKIDNLENDPENHIFEYFEEIKRQVDIRREELKLKLDNYSDEILQSIESAKENCVKLSQESKRLSREIGNSKKELTELIDRFDTFEIDEKKFEEIRQILTVLNRGLTRTLREYKDSLIDNKEYTFEFQEIDIKRLFGCFKEVQKTFESTIMGPCLQKKLLELCRFSKDQKWELKYRASKDGFLATDFHTKCDGIGNTLTVIKAKSGNIFGGYTEQKWHSRGGFVTDPNAFIFSLVNKEEKPFKVMCSNEGQTALYCSSNSGPCFGGHDFDIKSDSNINKESYCDFGFSYQHQDYLWKTDKAKNILAGSYKFETQDIEVFSKTN